MTSNATDAVFYLKTRIDEILLVGRHINPMATDAALLLADILAVDVKQLQHLLATRTQKILVSVLVLVRFFPDQDLVTAAKNRPDFEFRRISFVVTIEARVHAEVRLRESGFLV